MADWVMLHNGRVKRFRTRQSGHSCSKRRRGRPSVGRGMCYIVNAARAVRRLLNAQVRAVACDHESLEEFALLVPRGGYNW